MANLGCLKIQFEPTTFSLHYFASLWIKVNKARASLCIKGYDRSILRGVFSIRFGNKAAIPSTIGNLNSPSALYDCERSCQSFATYPHSQICTTDGHSFFIPTVTVWCTKFCAVVWKKLHIKMSHVTVCPSRQLPFLNAITHMHVCSPSQMADALNLQFATKRPWIISGLQGLYYPPPRLTRPVDAVMEQLIILTPRQEMPIDACVVNIDCTFKKSPLINPDWFRCFW